SVQGFPITYGVNGRQYLAVPAGTGGGQGGTTIPAEPTPEKKIAQKANAIFVFPLPPERGVTEKCLHTEQQNNKRRRTRAHATLRSASVAPLLRVEPFLRLLCRRHRKAIVTGLLTSMVSPAGVSFPVA